MAQAPIRSIAIVGYGLIGASLGQALRARDSQVQVHAIDVREVSAGLAGADVASVTSVEDSSEFRARLTASDVTVLAGPVSVIVSQLPSVLACAPLVTDCGSTKREIANAATREPRAEHFVPGHPMSGRTRGGFAAATPTLFEGRPWVICPEGAGAAAERRIAELVSFVGATPVRMSAAKHDAAVALTSHLPKLLASLLAARSRAANTDTVRGPAFDRVTHGSDAPVGIWKDIFESNADEIAAVARALGGELTRLAEELERGNVQAAEEVLVRGRGP